MDNPSNGPAIRGLGLGRGIQVFHLRRARTSTDSKHALLVKTHVLRSESAVMSSRVVHRIESFQDEMANQKSRRGAYLALQLRERTGEFSWQKDPDPFVVFAVENNSPRTSLRQA
jgi:hypothetical protein